MSFGAIPGWMLFVFAFVFIGPALRMGAGRRQSRRLEAALAERDAVIEDLQHRLSELESRLDFAERLVANHSGGPPTSQTPMP